MLLVALEGVYSTTDPPIKALRRVIPPLRIGSVSLDLSFLIVMIAAYVLLRVNRQSSVLTSDGGCTQVLMRRSPPQALLFDRQLRDDQ